MPKKKTLVWLTFKWNERDSSISLGNDFSSKNSEPLEVFLNEVCDIATLALPHVMARRLLKVTVCECLGYFMFLCVVHGCAYAFLNQWVEDFMHKTPKIYMHKSLWQSSYHHMQLCQCGNVAYFIKKNLLFEKKAATSINSAQN